MIEQKNRYLFILFTSPAFLLQDNTIYTRLLRSIKTSTIILTGYEPGSALRILLSPISPFNPSIIVLTFGRKNFILVIADLPTPHFTSTRIFAFRNVTKNVFQQRPVVEDLLYVEVWNHQEAT